jgi:hypothetical protein
MAYGWTRRRIAMKHFLSALMAGVIALSGSAAQSQSYVACARFTSGGHQLLFATTNRPKTGDELTISSDRDGEQKILYRDAGGEYVYVAPLSEDDSSFIVVWSGASGYFTKILAVIPQPSGDLKVSQTLEVASSGLPHVLQSGREKTMFILVDNASSRGNVRDVVDIYALKDGAYKFAARVPAHKELSTVEKLAEEYDRAAQQRGGTVVRP